MEEWEEAFDFTISLSSLRKETAQAMSAGSVPGITHTETELNRVVLPALKKQQQPSSH